MLIRTVVRGCCYFATEFTNFRLISYTQIPNSLAKQSVKTNVICGSFHEPLTVQLQKPNSVNFVNSVKKN